MKYRLLPDLSMKDDQNKASLNGAELNLKDIWGFTDAKISGDASFKEFIEGRIVDWSKPFQRKFTGSKNQDDKLVMSR